MKHGDALITLSCVFFSFLLFSYDSVLILAFYIENAIEGHDLEKPTYLLSDLPSLGCLERRITAEDRGMIHRRLQKRNQKRAKPRVYYVKKGLTVTGCKDLGLSAAYPSLFSRAVVKAWQRAWVEKRRQEWELNP